MSHDQQSHPLRLQPLVRGRLAGLGAVGERWAAGLGSRLGELEELWGVRAERRSLPGGSGSLAVPATTMAGEQRAIKVGIPGVDLSQEARLLEAAGGQGYALLSAHDASRQALLLERLGGSVEQAPAEPEEAIALLAATLRLAWQVSEAVAAEPGIGHDRASSLRRLITRLAADVEHDAAPAVLARALDYADRRAQAYDPARCVVVHGDPHPANLLRVIRARPGAGSGWCFVDPDGFRADPACDVGVIVRDWSSRLYGPDAASRLEGWCRLAAAASGQDEQAVWEWAFLQRVSTGLYMTSIGARGLGRTFLGSAAAALAGTVPTHPTGAPGPRVRGGSAVPAAD